MVMLEAQYLDDETVLQKLPNIYPEEIADILQKRDIEDIGRFSQEENQEEESNE